MQLKEKDEICLNYASNVPEWTLGIQQEAVSKLSRASQKLSNVAYLVTANIAYDQRHPDGFYYGSPSAGFTASCREAAQAVGEAVCALEELLSQADQFGSAKNIAAFADIAYNTSHVALEDRCRRHGCPEVAYQHG